MAYTLSDPFRPLRLVLRTNGALVGLGMGSVLLFSSAPLLSAWGIFTGGPLWPIRLAGSALVALGVCFLLIASQEGIGLAQLLTITGANTLFALVLFSAYLQQEFAGLALIGRIVFIFIFLLCLLGALAPLPYLRTGQRA
jgi:hypothetical protein